MTDGAHAEAFLTLLGTVTGPPALVVHDGSVPQLTAPPYVVVYFADADPLDSTSTALTHQARRHVTDAYVHCVGANGQAARIVSDRVRSALLNVAPAVAGRRCYPIRRIDGQPSTRDETTGRLVMDKIDVYRLSSIPA